MFQIIIYQGDEQQVFQLATQIAQSSSSSLHLSIFAHMVATFAANRELGLLRFRSCKTSRE